MNPALTPHQWQVIYEAVGFYLEHKLYARLSRIQNADPERPTPKLDALIEETGAIHDLLHESVV
jgi:hypothetical protein